MLVKDILNQQKRKIITAGEKTTIKQAMKLMVDNKISCLPVLEDDGKLVGIISDKDIFWKIYETECHIREMTVGEVMTSNLIVGVPEDEVPYIAGVMTENKIRHVPIIQQDRMIGLVSVGDIVKTQMENIKIENRYLQQYISGSYPG